MATQITPAPFVGVEKSDAPFHREAHSSGVSWGAVIGGAFVAAALYLILLALGAGFGLSAVSLWSNAGTTSTVGTLAIVWLIFIEVVASSMGGYLTGRLRTKWTLIHSDEVYFRDTANGFLAWAVAFVVSVASLASGAAAMAGTEPERAPSVAAAAPNMYFVDALFRSDRADAADAATKAEAGRILVRDLKGDPTTGADESYLARLVAARTGITQADAERRVADVTAQARQAADTARQATAHFLLWSFLALLLGAFSASLAATIGGRQRDHVKPAI